MHEQAFPVTKYPSHGAVYYLSYIRTTKGSSQTPYQRNEMPFVQIIETGHGIQPTSFLMSTWVKAVGVWSFQIPYNAEFKH
jgi:hypothetical protein